MIITTNPENLTKEMMTKVLLVLENDGLIVYPTETAYGIGCNALSETAIRKIFAIKQRDKTSPLPVIIDSVEMMKKIAQPSKDAILLSKQYHPGPLVLALPKKAIIPNLLNPKAIALRIVNSLPKNQIDLIIDIGRLPKKTPSTIVDFTLANPPQIIREGEIKAEGILLTLNIPQENWQEHIKNRKK